MIRVDTTGETKDTLEGLRIPAGWYLTRCESYRDGDDNGDHIWTFRITSGPFANQAIDAEIGNPDYSKTEKQQEFNTKRRHVWLRRLGLLSDSQIGKQADIDPKACIGQAFVVHMVDHKFTGKNGDEVNIPEPDFAGVMRLDHPEIPPADRVKLGIGLLPGQSIETAAPPADGKKEKTPRGRKAADAQPATIPATTPRWDPSDI